VELSKPGATDKSRVDVPVLCCINLDSYSNVVPSATYMFMICRIETVEGSRSQNINKESSGSDECILFQK
jgi:hypothetical protein